MPKGCAQGLQTLNDDKVGIYHMGDYHHPKCTCRIQWNDPIIGIIIWPLPVSLLSEKDQVYQNFVI